MDKIFKTVKQLILYSLLIAILSPISCIIKPQTRLQAYYEFRDDDFPKILEVELGQEISYQNEAGDILTYQIESVMDDYKKQHVSGGGSYLGLPVPVSYYFYYDLKQIKFNVNQSMYDIEYDFIRYPIDIEQAQNDSYTEFPSELIGQIFFVNWNGTEVWNGSNAIYSFGGIRINYNAETITMSINDTVYHNVYVIASGNPNPLVNGVITRTVNVIYYDKQHGIIGFDETDGKEWRLIN